MQSLVVQVVFGHMMTSEGEDLVVREVEDAIKNTVNPNPDLDLEDADGWTEEFAIWQIDNPKTTGLGELLRRLRAAKDYTGFESAEVLLGEAFQVE